VVRGGGRGLICAKKHQTVRTVCPLRSSAENRSVEKSQQGCSVAKSPTAGMANAVCEKRKRR
jgi:hypothetical protein